MNAHRHGSASCGMQWIRLRTVFDSCSTGLTRVLESRGSCLSLLSVQRTATFSEPTWHFDAMEMCVPIAPTTEIVIPTGPNLGGEFAEITGFGD